MSNPSNDEIRESVKEYYSDIARSGQSSCGCSSTSCCGGSAPASQTDLTSKHIGYADRDLKAIPTEANLGLGCGNPTGLASLKPGERVLDLGSGAGIDCFIAAQQVGDSGFVTGVDMSPTMIARARDNASKGGFTNVEFHLSTIENLPVPSNSIDVVISNCVINLSPEKPAVFREMFRVLKPGGRIAVSDIIATDTLPESVRANDALYCACIGGAASDVQLLHLLHDAGFERVRITPQDNTRTALRDLLPQAPDNLEVVSASIMATKPESRQSGGDSKEYFNRVADEWDTMRKGFFSDSVRDKALGTVTLSDGMTVGDIGAGSGFLTEALLNKGVSVVAIDQSEKMIDLMKKKFAHFSRVDYRVGSAERLPVEDKALDRVFANMYLHHVDQPSEAIREMTRILKPGGRLVITDLDEHKFDFLRTEHHDRWMGFRREDIRQWFAKAGLDNVTVDCVGDTCCATSACGCEEASVSIFLATGTKKG